MFETHACDACADDGSVEGIILGVHGKRRFVVSHCWLRNANYRTTETFLTII